VIPRQYEALAFAAILSGFMSLLVSAISTLVGEGWSAHFVGTWMAAWGTAWLFALPCVMVAAPLARKLAARLVA
jgi:hypothetical protein